MSKRRIPVDTFINDKKVSDVVYSKFQLESKFNGKGEPRIMDKVKLNKSEWVKKTEDGGELSGMSRTTLNNKIKYLKKVGLIVEKNEYFELPQFGTRYFLIPEDTLRYLVNTSNAGVIKTYTYLGSLWSMDKRNCSYTQNQLLELLGYNNTKTENHKKIKDIILCLVNNGLIEVEQRQVGKNKVFFVTSFSEKIKGMK